MSNDKPKMGRINSTGIAKNRDGDRPVRLMQVELTDPEDIQTVEQYTQPGIDSNPPADSLCEVVPNGNAWKVSVGINDKVDKSSDLSTGEIEIYSSDPESSRFAKQATSRYKNNKDIIHNAKDVVSNIDVDKIDDIGNNHEITIGNNRLEEISNDFEIKVGVDCQVDIGNDLIAEIINNMLVTANNLVTFTSGINFNINAGTALAMIAATAATIVAATITLTAATAVALVGTSISVNSGTRSGVSFPDLKTAFDSLRGTYNTHTHTDPQGGTTSTPLQNSTASVDGAESSDLKLT